MKRHLASILLTCPALAAQSTLVSPSPVFANSEGSAIATTFGAYQEARYQIGDGNLRGTARTITELAFRHDHSNYDASTGTGRTWTQVTLKLSECDLSSLSTTFSTNSTSQPTTVFQGSLSWPTKLIPAASLPADWSLTIPFTNSYSYAGTKDLLNDFTFTGGTLSNAATWTGSTATSYALDSFGLGEEISGSPVVIGKIQGGCRDSSSLSQSGAFLNVDTATFGPNVLNPVVRSKYFVEVTGANFGPRTPTILALAFGADPTGFALPGIPCNKIHLGLGRTWFMYPVTTNTIGNIPAFHFGISNGLLDYKPSWHGINLFVQAVWNDSSTGALHFSAGSRNSFMALPPANAAAAKMKAVFSPDPGATTATTLSSGAAVNLPIIRYKI